jgi:DNA-binding response OmpR family regulator
MDSKSLLIIEDEHFISELYSRALKKAGYDVVIMMSGEDGLRAAIQRQFDLVLLDLLVPGLSGMDVLEKIRTNDKQIKTHTKVIITTNLDQDESIRKKLEHIADGYLIKAEMTPKELVKIVNDFFGKK